MFCKNFKAVITATDQHGNMLVSRTRCKMWTCAYCATINRNIWNARIIDHINKKGGLWSWFTITAHSKARGANKSIASLRGAWGKLIKRMKRKHGKFDYVRVFEAHKDGSYHCHAIVGFNFGDIKTRKQKDGKEVKFSAWLADTAKELKIGYYTHADDIATTHHGGYVASYVTKYIVKLSPEQHKEIGRIRHIQASHGWGKLTRETEYTWLLKTGIYEKDLIDAIETGNVIKDINTGELVTSDDFAETYIYPIEFDAWRKLKNGD